MLTRRIAVALLVALSLSACYREVKQATKRLTTAIKEMQALEKKLQTRYPNEQVDLHLTKNPKRTTLTVTFVNSPLNDAKYMDRDARANEVAAFVKSSYDDADTIVVNFQKLTKAAAAKVTVNVDTFDYPGR